MTMDKDCIKCGVTLIEGQNISTYHVNNKWYLCSGCRDAHNAIVNKNRMWVNGKYISNSHPLHKAGRYKTFDDAAFAALEKDVKQKSGYVYAIRNPAWPEWVKIGKAVDAEDRLSSYQTSSPMRDYKLIHSIYFDDRSAAEKKAHILAALKTTHPWNKNDNGEWFKLTEEQAIEILREVTLD
jgi:hypothetical protein